MAVNVTQANYQAAQIEGKVQQLRNARGALSSYRSELQGNWQSQEVGLILQSVDGQIAELDRLLGSLNNLATDIRRAAAEIRREEEAAARAAAERAARERQQAQARGAYNAACENLDAITRERAEIVLRMQNTRSSKTMAQLNEQLADIDRRLELAQQECDRCRLALG